MFVVDTDTMTLLQRGHERVSLRFRQARREVVTTVISRIEILQGRMASVFTASDGEQLLRAHQRLEESESFLRRVPVLPVDVLAAEQFDRLRKKKSLRKIGRPDLLIASIALTRRATVVTRNLKHFRQVPGLDVENWAD
jgi:tRNA(fMet)-specific endonuclease VapC